MTRTFLLFWSQQTNTALSLEVTIQEGLPLNKEPQFDHHPGKASPPRAANLQDRAANLQEGPGDLPESQEIPQDDKDQFSWRK